MPEAGRLQSEGVSSPTFFVSSGAILAGPLRPLLSHRRQLFMMSSIVSPMLLEKFESFGRNEIASTIVIGILGPDTKLLAVHAHSICDMPALDAAQLLATSCRIT